MPTARHPGRSRDALAALAPALVLLAGRALGPGGAEGLFQAALAALVALVVLGAFVTRLRARSLLALLVGAGLLVPAHLLAGGALAGGGWLALLGAAVAAAAAGLAAVGRGLRAGAASAGIAAAAVLCLGLTGLVWADPVGDRLPAHRRFAFKQAVMHLDAATACAYDVAAFDRFHTARIYDRVRLASSAVRAPGAGGTGLVWLVFGLAALAAARALGADRDADGLRA